MRAFFVIFSGHIISVYVHELAHSISSYIGGGRRPTLNPLKFVDKVNSILLPLLFLIIWNVPPLPGGSTTVAPGTRLWASITSLAGPAANAIIAVLLALFLKSSRAGQIEDKVFIYSLALLVYFQVAIVLFNLIPVPPLDGFGWIEPYLPQALVNGLRSVQPYLFISLYLLIIYRPEVRHIFFGAAKSITLYLGVDMNLVQRGWVEFDKGWTELQFWKK